MEWSQKRGSAGKSLDLKPYRTSAIAKARLSVLIRFRIEIKSLKGELTGKREKYSRVGNPAALTVDKKGPVRLILVSSSRSS